MEQEFFHIELAHAVHLAVPLDQTAEVVTVQATDMCLIPGVAPALLGVTNQRGRLLWMADLEHLLGLKHPGRRPPRSAALVLNLATEKGELRLGCLVSQLRGIVACSPEQINPVPSRLDQRVRQFFLAWMQLPEHPSLLALNVEAVFAAVQFHTPPSSVALL